MNQQTTVIKPKHDHEYGSQIAVLRSDLDRLQGDFSKLSHEVAEDAGERIHEFGARANDVLREKGQDFRKVAKRGRKIAKKEMRRHPLATLSAATGIGIAVGALVAWTQR